MKCGWSLLDNGERLASGTWDLSRGPHGRFVMLRAALRDTLQLGRPDLVAYEHVCNHGKAGVLAGHVYGGICAVIELICHDHQLRPVLVSVQAAKKAATGKGNATKDDMVAAARARWHFDFPPGSDEADALWIADAAGN